MIKPLIQPVEMLSLQDEGGVKNSWGVMDLAMVKNSNCAERSSMFNRSASTFVMHARRSQRQYNFAPHNIVAMDETAV